MEELKKRVRAEIPMRDDDEITLEVYLGDAVGWTPLDRVPKEHTCNRLLQSLVKN